MNNTKRYIILWLGFALLYGIGNWLLQEIEGGKITTTEHMDFSYAMLILSFFIGLLFYLISFFPLSIIFQRLLNNAYIKVIIFSVLGGVWGKFEFERAFLEQFVLEYNLNIIISIFIFAICGLVYALVDIYTSQKFEAKT